jgi:hypothetical protein
MGAANAAHKRQVVPIAHGIVELTNLRNAEFPFKIRQSVNS